MKNVSQFLFLSILLTLSATASAMQHTFPLHRAAQKDNRFGMHEYLLYRDPEEVNALNAKGLTPLMVAVIYGHHHAVEDLVDLHNADITRAGPQGKTALHYAASKGRGKPKHRKKIAFFLMQHGASIDAQTNIGITPLHQAVIEGQNWIAITLLSFGANRLLQDLARNTPADYAQAKKNTKLMAHLTALLIEKKVEIGETQDLSETAACNKCKMLSTMLTQENKNRSTSTSGKNDHISYAAD